MNSFADQQYFHSFSKDFSKSSLPDTFTFPFCYEPHPLAKEAAMEVQHYLLTQTDWNHNFGLDNTDESLAIGKMFGVLVVKDAHGTLGFLAAVSGKLAGKNTIPYFVPPIFDMLTSNSFFLQEEEILNQLNRTIESLENSDKLANSKILYLQQKARLDEALELLKQRLRQAKKNRKSKRTELQPVLSEAAYEEIFQEMVRQSLLDKQELQKAQYFYQKDIETVEKEYKDLLQQIEQLKEERKFRSGQLQNKLFEQYNFLNAEGTAKNVIDVFTDFNQSIPPAGSGECAAPKLLQFAFTHGMQPIALAEFWWGKSPGSEIRKHKNYYPACRNKCEPILSHMLQGLSVEPNPLLIDDFSDIELPVIFEDDDIIVVNKPAEFLSVPGIHIKDSVYERMIKKYPDAGPLIIHRLDMSTSGILVLAKNKEAHHFIQRQFINHSITKHYIALLDGEIEGNNGKIELPLRVDLDNRPRQMVCYEYGKTAQTIWEKLEVAHHKTKVRFIPLTGRTHQLRMHAAHSMGLNTPIVGDDLYGVKADRLYLHAAYIEFVHPRTKQVIHFYVEPPF